MINLTTKNYDFPRYIVKNEYDKLMHKKTWYNGNLTMGLVFIFNNKALKLRDASYFGTKLKVSALFKGEINVHKKLDTNENH